MQSIDLDENKSKIDLKLDFSSRKSWQVFQDFESLQLESDQIIKNRNIKLHNDYCFEIHDANVFGYKTVISNNTFYSDEIGHDDFNKAKLQRTNFSPLAEQIVYNDKTNRLDVDTTLHRDIIEIDEAVGVFSDEPSNYGSFMYRVLPKIKKCLDLGLKESTFLFFDKPYMHEIIYRLLGVKIKTITHKHILKYKIDKLYLPSLRTKNCIYGPDCLDIFRNGATNVKKNGIGKRIYVSRRKMAKSKPNFRVMINEPALVKELEKFGFQEFCPEEHDIDTQIATFRDAEEIILAGGSALFNLPYCRKAKYIIDIESTTHWIYAHSNILYSVGVPFSVIYGSQLDSGFNLHKNWHIDINEVIKRLNRLRGRFC